MYVKTVHVVRENKLQNEVGKYPLIPKSNLQLTCLYDEISQILDELWWFINCEVNRTLYLYLTPLSPLGIIRDVGLRRMLMS